MPEACVSSYKIVHVTSKFRLEMDMFAQFVEM